MVVNFLHVNGKNYFIIVRLSIITIIIIVSRKLVNMGRKSCLFVYYVELIGTKLWMDEEVVTLNVGLESRMVENLKTMLVGFSSFTINFKRW
jgi:hypothetical protein